MKPFILVLINLVLIISFLSCEKDDNNPTNIVNNNQTNFPSEDGKEVINVSNVEELMATVYSTKEGNKVVVIEDGTYEVTDRLWLTGNNLIYRSASGDRDKVILKGKGWDNSIGWIFGVAGKSFAVRDLSVGEVKYHGIQVHGELDADSFYVQNVRFFNIRQQMIKGSFDKNKPGMHCDYGVVENCLFEYTDNTSYQYYCGGIDIHHGINWVVRNSVFKNIYSPESSLTEGGIHFWNNSEGTIVENNIIINCDRGIMFGLDSSPHFGGIIRNNMIYVTRDVGIYLCYAQDTKVYNNTVYIGSGYPNAIEYRFPETSGVQITNNLTNKAITKRDNGSATVDNNITNAQSDWFIETTSGDLHLAKNIDEVIDKAVYLEEVEKDIDGDIREIDKSDIGADEKK